MTSAAGVPLAMTLTPANCHDLHQLLPLVFLHFPRIGGRPGRWSDAGRRGQNRCHGGRFAGKIKHGRAA